MSIERMEDREIVTSYLYAKNRIDQVRILAELNLCTKDEIYGILASAGYGRDREWTHVDYRRISDLYIKGIQADAIARRLDMDKKQVLSRLREAKKQGYLPPEIDKIKVPYKKPKIT